MTNLKNEVEFHNKRVLEEIESGGRLSFVYKSMSNAVLLPRVMLPIDALNVLEIGSYLGDNTSGINKDAKYIGIDISDEAVKYANEIYANDNIDFICMDAHKVEELGTNFDYVYGNGILHHLDLDIFIPALRNILKDNGKAVFMEPNIGPPWLRIFRALTPSLRTDDEHPLTKKDYQKFSMHFKVETINFGIICPILPMMFLNNKSITKLCKKLDSYLSKTWLAKWSWISVLVLSSKDKA